MCGRDIIASDKNQYISSPGYPGYYYGDKDCEWVLTSKTPGAVIVVEFLEFQTERCCDFVTVSSDLSYTIASV